MVNILDKSQYQDSEGILAELLMNVRKRGIPLF